MGFLSFLNPVLGAVGSMFKDKEDADDRAYNTRGNQIHELNSKIEDYDNKLAKSNTKVSGDARELYNNLKGINKNKEPNSYRLHESADVSGASSMQSRLASRFNRSNVPQNALTKSQALSQSLTHDNQQGRINTSMQLGADKHAYDTYSNLFSTYIGNLNSESRNKENRVLSTEKSLHDQYGRLTKTLQAAQAKQRAEDNSFFGQVSHVFSSIFG